MDMERLITDSGQKVLLIIDNLKVHQAKLVAAWLAERKDQIEVFYLPQYSPEINPNEYQNRDFKTELRSSDRAATKKRRCCTRRPPPWSACSRIRNGSWPISRIRLFNMPHSFLFDY